MSGHGSANGRRPVRRRLAAVAAARAGGAVVWALAPQGT